MSTRDINNKFWNEELETMPREELEKNQLEDLKEIVKFAYDNAPYYKRSFDEAGVKPEDIHALADIQKFPFINKTTQREARSLVNCVPFPKKMLCLFQHRQARQECLQ